MLDSKLHYIDYPSSNYQEALLTPKYIILHCIGGTEVDALTLLTKPLPIGGGVSAHYFIPQHQANTVYQLVPDNNIAYHAGVSTWGTDSNLNHCAIGIELHCPNYANALHAPLDWFHFEPFEESQLATCITLIQALQQKFAIKPHHILAHSDVAPWRTNPQGEVILGKTDPGATFPWERLAKQGIGIWPQQIALESSDNRKISCKSIQSLLKQYGYNIPVSGYLDAATQHVIRAFQLHYMPQHANGRVSAHMLAVLEHLLDASKEGIASCKLSF